VAALTIAVILGLQALAAALARNADRGHAGGGGGRGAALPVATIGSRFGDLPPAADAGAARP
jgi:hypothetical protein